ncbi:MAG: hypothetical protein CW691_00315 [Candidatus Bathyarchaeum sp.]|nr:MAG: hypothetical protein CW691_00315 [Candidatus Bathyarchaeum sp.]
MTTLSVEFKRKAANMYIQNREKLEKLEPNTMEHFASKILEIIDTEKKKSDALHDLEVLEYNMELLKNYASKLKQYEPETDEYDFTQNDCTNMVDSTKKWLTLEGLI